ncbi:ribonuclease H, partial [Trifolium pratense]
APCGVLKNIERIQGTFLWGGGAEEKKLCWVKWDQICLPKEKGGLGVKNLELFNLALLSKWRWRFFNHDNALWTELLRHRYGHLPSWVMGGHELVTSSKASFWWRDVISSGRGLNDDWFRSNVSCRVGNGNDIEFWNFKWFGNHALRDLYPDLYAKETFKQAKVSERLGGALSRQRWRWSWLAPLDSTDDQSILDLQGLFAGFSLQLSNSDKWRWLPDVNGLFSVKSCYSCLLSLKQVVNLDAKVLDAIQRLWGTDIPSKIKIFGWRLLLNKLPTRAALNRRGILTNPHDLPCAFCFQQIEDDTHLFFSCRFSKEVWRNVLLWLRHSFQPGVEGIILSSKEPSRTRRRY